MLFTTNEIHNATKFAKTFLDDLLLVNHPDGDRFDRSHLKKLSCADRKACATALDVIQNAAIDDYNRVPADSISEDFKNGVKQLKSNLFEEIPVANNESPSWWKLPFVKIAKWVRSLALGILNVFGRVSTQKLFDKVEAYRRASLEAKTRLKELKGSNGLLQAAETAKEEALNKLFAHIEDQINPHLQALRAVNCIQAEAPMQGGANKNSESLKFDLLNRWSTEENDDTKTFISESLKIRSFKEAVIEIIDSRRLELNSLLDDLYDAAYSSDKTDEDVREIFKSECDRLVATINDQLVRKGDDLSYARSAALMEFVELEGEKTLLKKKYT